MKMYLISDNVDTLTGMRLAGVSGEVVHTREAFETCVKHILKKDDASIIIMTEKSAGLAPDIVEDIFNNRRLPLVVVIPDRHGSNNKDAADKNYFSSLMNRER